MRRCLVFICLLFTTSEAFSQSLRCLSGSCDKGGKGIIAYGDLYTVEATFEDENLPYRTGVKKYTNGTVINADFNSFFRYDQPLDPREIKEVIFPDGRRWVSRVDLDSRVTHKDDWGYRDTLASGLGVFHYSPTNSVLKDSGYFSLGRMYNGKRWYRNGSIIEGTFRNNSDNDYQLSGTQMLVDSPTRYVQFDNEGKDDSIAYSDHPKNRIEWVIPSSPNLKIRGAAKYYVGPVDRYGRGWERSASPGSSAIGYLHVGDTVVGIRGVWSFNKPTGDVTVHFDRTKVPNYPDSVVLHFTSSGELDTNYGKSIQPFSLSGVNTSPASSTIYADFSAVVKEVTALVGKDGFRIKDEARSTLPASIFGKKLSYLSTEKGKAYLVMLVAPMAAQGQLKFDALTSGTVHPNVSLNREAMVIDGYIGLSGMITPSESIGYEMIATNDGEKSVQTMVLVFVKDK